MGEEETAVEETASDDTQVTDESADQPEPFTGLGVTDDAVEGNGTLVPPEEDTSEVDAAVEAGIVSNDGGEGSDTGAEDLGADIEADQAEAAELASSALTDAEDEFAVEDTGTVFVLTSKSAGIVGTGVHLVGVFESQEAAEEYAQEATPPVADGEVTEWAVQE